MSRWWFTWSHTLINGIPALHRPLLNHWEVIYYRQQEQSWCMILRIRTLGTDRESYVLCINLCTSKALNYWVCKFEYDYLIYLTKYYHLFLNFKRADTPFNESKAKVKKRLCWKIYPFYRIISYCFYGLK